MLFNGRLADEAGQGILQEESVGEHGIADTAADIGIPHPATTIALGGVPNIVLHRQVRRIRPDLPDAVEQRIRGLK